MGYDARSVPLLTQGKGALYPAFHSAKAALDKSPRLDATAL
jgi:hypothetical protein